MKKNILLLILMSVSIATYAADFNGKTHSSVILQSPVQEEKTTVQEVQKESAVSPVSTTVKTVPSSASVTKPATVKSPASLKKVEGKTKVGETRVKTKVLPKTAAPLKTMPQIRTKTMGTVQGEIKKIGKNIYLYLKQKVRKIEVYSSRKKLASLRGAARVEITKFVSKAKNDILDFVYYDMKNKKSTQQFNVATYKTKNLVGPKPMQKATRPQSEATVEAETQPEPDPEPEPIPEPEPEPEPESPLQIVAADVFHTGTQYRWIVSIANMGEDPISGNLTVDCKQRAQSNFPWSGAGGSTAVMPAPGQTILEELGWTRNPNSIEYKVTIELNNQVVDEMPYTMAPLGLSIGNVSQSYNGGVTYTWTADLNNSGQYPLTAVKAEAFKKQGTTWVSAGVNTDLNIPIGTSSMSHQWNANGAEKFKLVISVKQGMYSPYTELDDLETIFSAQHSPADEAADTAAAQAAAAALAAETALHENMRANMPLNATLGQSGGVYQWNIDVTNNNSDPFTQELSVYVEQREGSSYWQSGGEKLVGELAPGQTKSMPVGWTRRFETTEARVQLVHNNHKFNAINQNLVPVALNISNLTLSDNPNGSKQWQATISNPIPFDIYYVKVKAEKNDGTWSLASSVQEGLVIPANGSLNVTGVFDPGSANQFRLTAYAKRKERYAPYEELATQSISF